MRTRDFISMGHLRFRLVVVLTVIVIVSVASMFMAVVTTFGTALGPELENRTRLIGATVRSDLQRVLQSGIQLDALAAQQGFLENAIAPFPEVRRVAVLASDGTLVAQVVREEISPASERDGLHSIVAIGETQFSLPVIVGNREVGRVEVEGSPQFVQTRLRNVFLDVGVLSFMVVLVGVEIAILFVVVGLWKPYGRLLLLLGEQMKGRFTLIARVSGPNQLARTIRRLNEQVLDLARRAPSRGDAIKRLRVSDFADMRLVLLIYVMGAEITASFLPLYGASVSRSAWISAEFAAAVPVGAFLVGVAVLSPFAGGLARRFGARRLFVVTAMLTAIAQVGLALADTIVAVAAARGTVAVLFALASISCQQYALQVRFEPHTPQGMGGAAASSSYHAMVFGGLVGGSALGGVVSSLFSYQSAIMLGAASVLLSAALGSVFMNGDAGRRLPEMPERAPTAQSQREGPAVGWRLIILIGCVGAPLAATTAIFVWYLTPLQLSASGYNTAEIGRVVMLYYLMLVVVGPLSHSMFRGWRSETSSIILGLAVTAAALFLHRFTAQIVGYAIVITVLGIGHALIRSSLLSAVVTAAGSAQRPVNAFRGTERLGGLIGLSVGALFLSRGSADQVLEALAWISIAGAVLLLVSYATSRA